MTRKTAHSPLLWLGAHLRLMLLALVTIHLALTALLAIIVTTPSTTPTVDGLNFGLLPAVLFAVAAFGFGVPLAWVGFAIGLGALDLLGVWWATHAENYWAQLAPNPMAVAGILFGIGACLAAIYQVADLAWRLNRIKRLERIQARSLSRDQSGHAL